MGIPERREREKTERRKAILGCARELILERGVERVSMEEIAQKAELSKATLYLYFSGKELIFNEICEESARIFLDHISLYPDSHLDGISALRHFWHGFMELFGNFDEMIIIFKVRNFLNPGQPFVSQEEHGKSPYVDAILSTMKNLIDQCKAEKIFDSNLDSSMATRLLLMLFSNSVDSASRLPEEIRNSHVLFDQMKKAFQILIYGFASEGVHRSQLNITG
ncbi:MAG: TetR/AcrR family transcriptional regulator [Treponema sp.]|nr:TetR/AcrR family transcriptional regulator [Treponema sp.]